MRAGSVLVGPIAGSTCLVRWRMREKKKRRSRDCLPTKVEGKAEAAVVQRAAVVVVVARRGVVGSLLRSAGWGGGGEEEEGSGGRSPCPPSCCTPTSRSST